MAGTLIGVQYGVSASESWNDSDLRKDTDHTAIYVVQSDDESDREAEIGLTSGVPKIGSASDVYFGCTCISRNITEQSPLVWHIECQFSSVSNGGGGDEVEEDVEPWDRQPEWFWGAETMEEPLLYDAQDPDIAIANSALEPLPPITKPVVIPVLTIDRYELDFDPDTILLYTNKVNDGEFWGADIDQALMAAITAKPERINGTKVWKVTYVIKFKIDEYGWTVRLLDQGTYYWSGTVGSSQKLPFSDDAFQQVIGNLNGSGGKNTTTTPEFVTFNRYENANFDDLNLGPWS